MLTRLRLRNFKAWRDSGDLRLAPLTVVFGGNSAGKTSITQLLFLLRRSVLAAGGSRTFDLEDRVGGAPGYRDLVHGHDVRRALGFALEWKLDRALALHDPVGGERFAGDRMGIAAQLHPDEKGQARLEWLRYQLIDGEGEVLECGDDAPLAARLRPELERALGRLHYLGPLRDYPARRHAWDGGVPADVGERGENAIPAIVAAGAREFRWRPESRSGTLMEMVAERLAAMGLAHDFRVVESEVAEGSYEPRIRTAERSPEVALADVGFGVSQLLPVIVAALHAPPHSTVILEQPEMHLHPRIQADVADLFVDAIDARENGRPRHSQFIVESHSEHFLRRLQRRIAEGALGNEDVALHFVRGHDGEAVAEELDVDAFGNITNWPDAFFGDDMADLVARAEAQGRRQRRHGGADR